jgi:L-threonylcarbamoyladenylate synthase
MDVVTALRAGRPVLLPTDTVYGLMAMADEDGVRSVYQLKGRSEQQPTALMTTSVDVLKWLIPELPEEAEALLPGPVTLVVPNPARRYPWLCGETPERIGVRVPVLPAETRAAIEAVTAVLATSANDPGGPSPARLDDVPARIREGAAAELDLGPLAGVASTVIDLTAPEPRVLREGAVSAAEALSTIQAWRLRTRPSRS